MLHNKEANVKTLIATLSNRYEDKIEESLRKHQHKVSENVLNTKKTTNTKPDMEKMKELVTANKNAARPLFSDDIAEKVLNHKSNYKLEE